MKKNRMMRIAAFLLVAALLSICVVSGTYAKYTSEITGTDTARVAKWDVQVNNVTAGSKDGAVAKTFVFDLFKTITDTDGTGTETETDMKPTDGSIIAPGTQGNFTINLHNASEVTAEYKVAFEVTNTKNIPIEFSVNNGTWGTLADITTAVQLAIGEDDSIKVAWRWAFDGNDANDTALGLDGTATITVAAVVTATQVD